MLRTYSSGSSNSCSRTLLEKSGVPRSADFILHALYYSKYISGLPLFRSLAQRRWLDPPLP